jgi:archaemetzincin
MERLALSLAHIFETPCQVQPQALDITFAFDQLRGQYHSTLILQRLAGTANGSRILAVAPCDLYVPILTFVFGEAQVEGDCAVVSTARLREEFYGLPPREDLLHERLVKESVHELGHTFGLRHCDNWRCVMASSYAVERIDVKGAEFCQDCRSSISARTTPSSAS